MSKLIHEGDGFHARIHPSKPMTTHGHQPGIKVGNDRYPEFHAETYPPGTAPADRSFRPNPVGTIPGQALNQSASDVRTDPLDFPGATSADVNKGYGRPSEGLQGRDHRGNTSSGGGGGLVGVAGNAGPDPVRQHGWDLPEGVEKGSGDRGKGTGGYPAAGDRVPASAEEIASERR